MPPPPPPPPPGMPAVANVQPQATLEVVADESVLEPGSPEQEDFIAQLIRDLAASLGVEESEIQIDPASLRRGRRRLEDSRRALQDGAIQFDFVISSPNSAAAIAELNAQLADPESELRNAPSTQALNPDVLPVLEFVCPDRMVIPPGLTTCQFCPAGQEPDDPDDPVGCQLCSASGSYLVSENGTCHTCPPGKTPRDDLTGCDNCEKGFLVRMVGSAWLARRARPATMLGTAAPAPTTTTTPRRDRSNATLQAASLSRFRHPRESAPSAAMLCHAWSVRTTQTQTVSAT